MIIYIKDGARRKVKGCDTEINIKLNNIDNGLYLYNPKDNTLRKIKYAAVDGKLTVVNQKDFEDIKSVTGKIINHTGRHWELIELKYPVKKGIFEGSPVEKLAYEIIEFEISNAEAKKYKNNIISYEEIGERVINNLGETEKYGIAKAYRYKFAFCYLSDSLNIPEEIKRNYTKDREIYLNYNHGCRIIAIKDDEGKITDRTFYEMK